MSGGVSDRAQWPVEPGDYVIGNPESPVAISTLSDLELLRDLKARLDPDKYAILGVTRTHNIGVEKLIRNIAANPHITYLVLAGHDSESSRVAPVILALSRRWNGPDLTMSIQGRDVNLVNLTREEVEEFRRRVRVIDMSGVRDPEALEDLVDGLSPRKSAGGPLRAPGRAGYVKVEASDDGDITLDDRGFFIIYINKGSKYIICEHYDNAGRKTAEIAGNSARAIYKTVVKMGLLSRLDHAAYLGRELARAECALMSGEDYIQDRA